jgi:hypothetical protein
MSDFAGRNSPKMNVDSNRFIKESVFISVHLWLP